MPARLKLRLRVHKSRWRRRVDATAAARVCQAAKQQTARTDTASRARTHTAPCHPSRPSASSCGTPAHTLACDLHPARLDYVNHLLRCCQSLPLFAPRHLASRVALPPNRLHSCTCFWPRKTLCTASRKTPGTRKNDPSSDLRRVLLMFEHRS